MLKVFMNIKVDTCRSYGRTCMVIWFILSIWFVCISRLTYSCVIRHTNVTSVTPL